jgi:hypothetical protein
LLAELRRLREIQIEQAEALAAADLERLSVLNGERLRVQARIVPSDTPALSPADAAEARVLVDLLERDQRELVERAGAARDALRAELGSLRAGRTALAGYRPAGTGSSLYLDSAR